MSIIISAFHLYCKRTKQYLALHSSPNNIDAFAVTAGQIYVTVVGSLACNYATIPLFFEVGEDLAYPVPEILVSSVITAADNICTTIYLFICSIPNIGEEREEKGEGEHRRIGRNTNG